jgi:hypothetical protein
MYIRSREDALEALGTVLALPERREQIIQLTVKVAGCLDPEARAFLADCQEGLIGGGLEAMRRRRRELLDSLRGDTQEAILIVDSSEDHLLEDVGRALDVLRMAEVARQVFGSIREDLEAWEIGRAVLTDEEGVRRLLTDAVRSRGGANQAVYRNALEELRRRAAAMKPPWDEAAPALAALCDDAVLTPIHPEGRAQADNAAILFAVVAVSDDRARLLIELLASERGEALDYLGELRRRIDALYAIEARRAR